MRRHAKQLRPTRSATTIQDWPLGVESAWPAASAPAAHEASTHSPRCRLLAWLTGHSRRGGNPGR